MTTRTGDWTPVDFERHGNELLAVIREHFEHVRDIPVARPHKVAELISRLDSPLPELGEDFSQILTDTKENVLPDLVHWNHPSFYGYFCTCASFPGVLAETLTAAVNVNAMLWKTSPAASALEQIVLRWIAQMVGFPRESDGVLVNGASLATLYALAVARDAALDFDVREQGIGGPDAPVLRIYTSDQAHSSVEKAAITLGIGLSNVIKIQSDDQYRMRVDLLQDAILRDIATGRIPVAVVATIGTTAVGAADPLAQIAEVCQRQGVWLHVDAAYGGLFGLVSRIRSALEDLSVGDSLVVNPQKTLFVPLEATALYCRRMTALANTFRLVPDYLTSTRDRGSVDYMDLSPQLGRSFRALKIWWVIRSFGRSGLEARLDFAMKLADWLKKQADAHPDWQRPAQSVYPLVCLRYVPESLRNCDLESSEDGRAIVNKINAQIVERLNASGDAFVSHATLRDGYAIRVSLANIHTTKADVERLWTQLTLIAEKCWP